MPEINLTIKKSFHDLSIRILPFSYSAQYSTIQNKIKFWHRFSNDKYRASYAQFHNLVFFGTSLSLRNWQLYLEITEGHNYLLNMKNGHLYIINSTNNPVEDEELDQLKSEECESIFSNCVNHYKELYSKIKNKSDFKSQMIELIGYQYANYNLSEIFVDVKQYFENYILAENECSRISIIINTNQLFDKYIELAKFKNIDHDHLISIIENAIIDVSERYKYSIDIWYSRNDVLSSIESIITHNIEEAAQLIYLRDIKKHNKIRALLENKASCLHNPHLLYDKIESLLVWGEIKSDESMLKKADELISQCMLFEAMYEHFTELKHIRTIELSPEKEELFYQFEKGNTILSKQELAEYKLYSMIKPYYESILFYKNKKRLKPSIEQFDEYVTYVKQIINLLLHHRIIKQRGKVFIYNKYGNVECLRKDLNRLHSNTEQ